MIVLPPVRPSNTILVDSAGPTAGVTEDDIASDNDMEELMVKEDDEDVDDVHNLEDKAVVEDSKEHIEAHHSEIGDVTISLSGEISSETGKGNRGSMSTQRTKIVGKHQRAGTVDTNQHNKSKKKEFKQMIKKRKRAGMY